MPQAPKRPCAHPGCPALVDKGRCEAHQKAAHRTDREARGSAAERGYDAQWTRFRNWYIRQYPLCRECEKQGRVTATEIVDHIIPLAQGGDKYDERNLQPLCRSHHQEKTSRETRG